jgi:hypothetical protein
MTATAWIEIRRSATASRQSHPIAASVAPRRRMVVPCVVIDVGEWNDCLPGCIIFVGW